MCMYDERANDNRVYRHILALTSSLLEPPLFALLGAPVALLAVMTALHINKLTFHWPLGLYRPHHAVNNC